MSSSGNTTGLFRADDHPVPALAVPLSFLGHPDVKVGKLLRAVVLFAVIVGIAAGCSPVRHKDAAERKEAVSPPRTLWPQPPDQPRYRYAGSLRSAKDVVRPTDAERLRALATSRETVSDKPVIDRPSGIAVRHGRVYVAEPSAQAVTVFDMQRRRLFSIGRREPDVLRNPQSIALDDEGFLYVLDSKQDKVVMFDHLGLALRSFSVKEGFTNPVGVAVAPDGKVIYVVDRGDLGNSDHKVVAFSPEGKELFRLGPRGSEDGRFNIPLAAAVGPDNTLYVADAGNFRIQAFDAKGKFRFSFGGPGALPGQFSRPRSIAVGADGNVYVADAGFNNVQIFTANGEALMPLGRLSRDPGPSNYALIAGIAVDESRRLFVNDHYFKKIEVFEPVSEDEGQRLAASGS